MKIKTILFTIDNYHIGGITSFIKTYISALDENYKVILIAREDNLTNSQDFFKNCTPVTVSGKVRFSLIGRLLDSFQYLKELHKIYMKYQPEVVHLNEAWSSLYSFLHPLTWRKKRVITFYGAYDLEEISSKSIFNKKHLKLKKTLQKFSLQSSHKIIVFSQFAKKLVLTHFGDKLNEKILLIPGSTQTKQIKHLKNKELTLVNFGRAEPRKGLDLIFVAVSELLKRGIKTKLYLASPVEFYYYTDLLKVYQENNLFLSVHLTHLVSSEQKEHLLQMADLFIMPSVELETFGLTVIESLAHGVPVIGSDCGAIPEILSKVNKQLIFSKKSPESLVEKITWYSQLSNEEKQKIRIKCIRTVEQYYSVEKNKQKIMSIYG